jgi:choline-sulfatase
MARRVRWAAVLITAAVAAVCAPRSKPLNLVVITLDTFRADRIGAYGSGRGLTPAIDELAREGVVFETASSVAPLTLPAHASLFTGLFPPRHGVRENAGVLPGATGGMSLASVLSRSGFDTGAFVASSVLDHSRGLARGFARYDDVEPMPDGNGHRARRSADQVVTRATEWMDGVRDARFFAWLHFYDAHAPCTPPARHLNAHARPYDAAVAFVDEQVGVFIRSLEQRGLLDRTVIVIVGDHGESLGDHGEATHGLFVYESVLHVPLIVRAPGTGLTGRRVSELVRSVDVMPTILRLLGLRSGTRTDGESLLPLDARPARVAYAENLYPQVRFGWSAIRALRTERFKLIETARPELYDLATDPGEQQNLFDTRRAVAERLLRDLNRQASADVIDEPATIAPARDRLASLGYVSSGPTLFGGHPEGRDPKDMVTIFNALTSLPASHPPAASPAPVTGSEVHR